MQVKRFCIVTLRRHAPSLPPCKCQMCIAVVSSRLLAAFVSHRRRFSYCPPIFCRKILIAAPPSPTPAVRFGGNFLKVVNFNLSCNLSASTCFLFYFQLSPQSCVLSPLSLAPSTVPRLRPKRYPSYHGTSVCGIHNPSRPGRPS
jgi:hypothetical protein